MADDPTLTSSHLVLTEAFLSSSFKGIVCLVLYLSIQTLHPTHTLAKFSVLCLVAQTLDLALNVS
jgi:hypothetical protein